MNICYDWILSRFCLDSSSLLLCCFSGTYEANTAATGLFTHNIICGLLIGWSCWVWHSDWLKLLSVTFWLAEAAECDVLIGWSCWLWCSDWPKLLSVTFWLTEAAECDVLIDWSCWVWHSDWLNLIWCLAAQNSLLWQPAVWVSVSQYESVCPFINCGQQSNEDNVHESHLLKGEGRQTEGDPVTSGPSA